MPNWAYSWPLPLAFLSFLWVLFKAKDAALGASRPSACCALGVVERGREMQNADAKNRLWISHLMCGLIEYGTGILSQEIRVTVIIILLENNRGGRRGDRDAPIGTGDVGDAGAIRLSSDLGSDTGATSVRFACSAGAFTRAPWFSMAPGGKEAGAWIVIGSGEEATKLADCGETGLKHEVLFDRG
ncbi:hypothetical protein EDB92DRAFT_1819970 [Lactarius akahatsu]|uniref:Secreted protein n=1 Tax=Lactarius akahatsu TaxID=416441 RepID=A0AAD4LBN2_9AGAM|nr:hypothetical protein EDB92DRAFT_1819970 [Lactarius akahatsu]